MIPTERTDEDYVKRHRAYLDRTRAGPVDVLLLGDSITRRWEEVPELWESCLGRHRAANFGIGGDTVQSLHWRLLHGELDGIQPKIVVLLIGTNNVPVNTAEETVDGIAGVLATIREKLPRSRVLLLAILPRGPQRPESASKENPYHMDKVRAINRGLSRLADRVSVHYLDMGPRLLGADMPDGLHLVESGYRKWADIMGELLPEVGL